MRKLLKPAKPSFLGEGTWDKIFFSPVNCLCHFRGSSHPFNPVITNIFLLILCKLFLSEKKC